MQHGYLYRFSHLLNNLSVGKLQLIQYYSYLFGILQNNIPVHCPGLTDGSLGDMLYFHYFKSQKQQPVGSTSESGLIVDIVQGFCSIHFTLLLHG